MGTATKDSSSEADEVISEEDESPPFQLEDDSPRSFSADIAGMDAARIAELFVRRVAAVDKEDQTFAPQRMVKKPSKPRLVTTPKLAGATTRKKTGSAAAGSGANEQPHMAFAAEIRALCRVGTNVWTAERDGCLVVREGASGKLLEKLLPHGWESVLCLTPVGPSVWCGTSDGPILIFDKQSRKLVREARHHSGGVQCLCASPGAGGRGFVVSGGSDWRMVMWTSDGSRVLKTFSGHTGGVRCCIVLGLEIWTGSDDGTVRVWEAACGLFQLESEPCRAVLGGHGGAVHAMLAHSERVLSCSADGSVRCWRPEGEHECVHEVSLHCGPVYTLVPMGRAVWAAGADGSIHTLDGSTLQEVSAPRQAHASFVTGLCQLQARTTRQCWSYSTSDGRACKWRVEELEPQHTAERAGLLNAEVAALTSQLNGHVQERRDEQVRFHDQSARDADALLLSETALEEARAAQRELLEELANSMDAQERDVQEAERLRIQLASREAALAELGERLATQEHTSAMAMDDLATRLACAEADARAKQDELEQLAAAQERQAASMARRQQAAERVARKTISSFVRAAREHGGLGAATRVLRRSPRPESALTHAALTRALDTRGWDDGEGREDAATNGAQADETELGEDSPPPATSLASTINSVATSLDEMMDSSDVPTVSHLPPIRLSSDP